MSATEFTFPAMIRLSTEIGRPTLIEVTIDEGAAKTYIPMCGESLAWLIEWVLEAGDPTILSFGDMVHEEDAIRPVAVEFSSIGSK